MNPIEILEILAIAVHRFKEMLGVEADFGQLSAGQCRLQPDSRPHIRINPILTKQKKNQRKLPEQVIVSWPDRSLSLLANWACFYVVLSQQPSSGGHNIYHNIRRLLSAKHSGITSSLDKF